MKYFLFLFVYCLVSLFIQRSGLFEIGIKRVYIHLIFLLKVTFGVIYTYAYASLFQATNVDVFNYFNDSAVLYELFFEDQSYFWELFFYNGGDTASHLQVYHDLTNYISNRGDYTIIRLHTFIRFISNGFIYTHLLIFNSLALIGLVHFYQFWKRRNENASLRLFVVISLFPSILLFASGLHKEAIITFCIGVLLNQIDRMTQLKWFDFISITLIAILFAFVRDYVFFLFVISVSLFYLSNKYFQGHIIAYSGLLILLLIPLSLLPNDYNWFYELINKRLAFQELSIGRSSYDMIHLYDVESYVFASLEAIYNGVFRPSWYPFKSVPNLIFASLNFLYISLFGVFYLRNQSKLEIRKEIRIVVLMSFILLFVYGFVVNNEGALARYKMQVWFLLTPLLANLLDQRIETKLSFLKKD